MAQKTSNIHEKKYRKLITDTMILYFHFQICLNVTSRIFDGLSVARCFFWASKVVTFQKFDTENQIGSFYNTLLSTMTLHVPCVLVCDIGCHRYTSGQGVTKLNMSF